MTTVRTLAVVVALLAGAAVPAGASHVTVTAPLAPVRDALPTPLARTDSHPVDLDGDGVQELVVVSRDGVAQAYEPTGVLRWSVADREILAAAGAQPLGAAATILGDFEGAGGCRPQRGVATTDLTADGVDDVVVALNAFVVEEQTPARRGVVARIDGATGALLGAELHGGLLAGIVLADLDGDGTPELLVAEEDGPPEEEVGFARFTRGTGGTTRVTALDAATGATRWIHHTGRAWAVLIDVGTVASPSGTDVVAAVTAAQEGWSCAPAAPEAAAVAVRLRGGDASPSWEATVDGDAVELAVAADGVLVRSPRAVTILDGATGAERGRAAPTRGSVGDVAILADGRAVAAWTEQGSSPSVGEATTVVALLDPRNAAVADAVVVDGDAMSPAVASQQPDPGRARLAPLPAGAGASAVAVRTERGVARVDVDPVAQVRWQRPHETATDPHVLTAWHGAAGLRLLTQREYRYDYVVASNQVVVSGARERDIHRLVATDPRDGALRPDDDVPLVGTMLGAARADLDGDGGADRVVGGVSGGLFAFDGGTGALRWATDLRNAITDVWARDIDGDGVEDLLVSMDLELAGVDGRDGTVRWRWGLDTLNGAGSWRGVALEDVDGDGVDDVVLGYRASRQQGWHPVEHGRVIVVSGATGAVLWQHDFPPHVKSVHAVATADATGDGTPDVAVTLATVGLAKYYAVAVLDGASGNAVWEIQDVRGSGDEPWYRDSVAFVDGDGDGDPDVLTLSTGGFDANASVTAHDGRTGAQLWQTDIGTIDGQPLTDNGHGMRPAVLADGTAGVVVFGEEGYDGHDVVFAQAIDGSGTRRWQVRVPGSTPGDFAVGDVTGDGVSDAVLPFIGQDGYVIDGASASVRAAWGSWESTKAVLVQADADPALEVELLTSPMGYPVSTGVWGFNTTSGRGKTVTLLDVSP